MVHRAHAKVLEYDLITESNRIECRIEIIKCASTASRVAVMVGSFAVLGAVCCAFLANTVAQAERHDQGKYEFVDNGVIRVGVDTDRGGVIGYLAPSGGRVGNVINEGDMGREVQLAFYAEPSFYNPPAAQYPKGACNKSHLDSHNL